MIFHDCRKIIFLYLTAMLCLLFRAGPAFCQDISMEMTVDKKEVAIGQRMRLGFTFYGTQNVPALQLPQIDGFKTEYVGPSTQVSIVNGKISSSITHNYSLLALRIGTYQVGPFSFDYQGREFNAKPVTVSIVSSPSVRSGRSAEETIYTEKLKDRVFLIMEVGKANAYVNERIPVKIKLYVNRLSLRDIEYPDFAGEGFSVREFDKPKQYTDYLGGIGYEVVEFETSVYALNSGEFTLGPAFLECNLLVKKQRRSPFDDFDDFFRDDTFGGFFSRYQAYPITLESGDIKVNIMPLPGQGRPADFSGAQGQYRMKAEIKPNKLKAGDPITVRTEIEGRGNIDTVVPPELSDTNNFKIYQPRLVDEGENRRVYEQVIIPETKGVTAVPEITFNYFDTKRGVYRVLTEGPFPIEVSEAETSALKVVDAGEDPEGPPLRKEELGKDIVYIKDSPGDIRDKGYYLFKNRIFLWSQCLPLLVFISLLVVRARALRLKSDTGYTRRMLAPKKARKALVGIRKSMSRGAKEDFYDSVFKMLQEYLGDKFQIPSKGITENVADELLKKRKIDPQIADSLKNIFRECDMARFAPARVERAVMEKTFENLRKILDYFERHK
jgi:hypothetical protein